MPNPIKIDFVSDVACPWCAIGLKSLEAAMARVGEGLQVELHFQPFELNPQMAAEGEDTTEHLVRKYGMTAEQVAKNGEGIRARGESLGFEFRMDRRRRMLNTFDAHRLLHWAGIVGGQHALKRALFEAYFTNNQSPADHEVLVAAARAAGLDADAARDVLASGRYADEVRAAERRWHQAGINSVPAVIVNDRYLISGGQPADAFERAIRTIAAEAA